MHVLIADDSCGESMAHALCTLGLTALPVSSLAVLDATLCGLAPDAIVLDLRLPGAAPEDVIPFVRLRYSGRIVVASGDDSAPALAALHGCECLPKPYDPAALAAVLKGP